MPIDFCAVVDAGLVERLVPDAEAEHEGVHCVWAGRGVGLQVRPVGPDGQGSTWTSEQLLDTYGTDKDVEPWNRTSAQAHETYRTRHAGDLRPSELTIWSDPAIGVLTANRRDATTTAARALDAESADRARSAPSGADEPGRFRCGAGRCHNVRTP
uniref:Uncharacterized protein n=1 Tax=Nonomuraea gerenzanensis TaxID=93944 RepID=A0A1M4EDS7_9ACTN|nr:hypothetical protein BN4615_P6249 [Nonomuraea gerenzanensis]